MRQIVLDTETTGLEPMLGHRIIEIGCVELVDRRITRRSFHRYLQPDREIDAGAVDVHGITNEFLADKPRFSEVAEELMAFIDGAELIIHNAPFDIGFLNHELRLIEARWADVCLYCGVLDTLALARQLHPGQKNTLDALCRRYRIDNSQRQLHGALLDAEILTDVYLAMTGGQVALALDSARIRCCCRRRRRAGPDRRSPAPACDPCRCAGARGARLATRGHRQDERRGVPVEAPGVVNGSGCVTGRRSATDRRDGIGKMVIPALSGARAGTRSQADAQSPDVCRAPAPGLRSPRSYSAMTCAPNSRITDATSKVSRIMITVANEP